MWGGGWIWKENFWFNLIIADALLPPIYQSGRLPHSLSVRGLEARWNRRVPFQLPSAGIQLVLLLLFLVGGGSWFNYHLVPCKVWIEAPNAAIPNYYQRSLLNFAHSHCISLKRKPLNWTGLLKNNYSVLFNCHHGRMREKEKSRSLDFHMSASSYYLLVCLCSATLQLIGAANQTDLWGWEGAREAQT